MGAIRWLRQLDAVRLAAGLGALLLWVATAGAGAADYRFLEDEGEAEFNVAAELAAPEAWPRGAEVRLVVNHRDEGEHYLARLSDGQATLVKVKDGRERVLAAGRWPAAPRPVTLTLQRRAGETALLADSRLVVRAHDDELTGGRVGWAVEGAGVTLTDVRLQPVAPPTFEDNFMRETDISGVWEMLRGAWRLSGLQGPNPTPTKAANPFTYQAVAEGPALAATGYWFWDSYDFRVAARASAPGAMGVCACLQNADSFYLFRWTRGDGPPGGASGRQQLLVVKDGTWRPLAERKAAFEVNRWYELGLQTSGGRLVALVDGEVVLRAEDTTFLQGRVGLFADSVPAVSFDDVCVRPWQQFREGFDVAGTGRWAAPRAGSWNVREQKLFAAGEGDLLVAGRRDWRDYVCGATVALAQAQSAGLVCGYQGPADYYLFRLTARPDQTALNELVRVRNNEESVLASAPGPLVRAAQRMKVELCDGRLRGQLEGGPELEAADLSFPRGKVGVYVTGAKPATFDDVEVRFLSPPQDEPPITTQFTQEDTMAEWAQRARAWQTVGDTLWHEGLFFEDVSLRLRLPQLGRQAGSLAILSQETAADGAPTATLTLESDPAQKQVRAQVTQGGTTIAQAALPAPDQPLLRVDRRGGCLLAWLNDHPLVAAQVGGTLRGGRLGVKATGFSPDLSEAAVLSRHQVDYTFSLAPTAWAPEFGEWDVRDRWSCSPGWAWFGGSGHESPLVWSKRAFAGDQVVDFWAALGMDVPAPLGYSHPSDLNVTICGDGEHLCSGYSFVFAGADNTKSVLLKGKTVLAENANAKFVQPGTGNYGFHRHWFHLRVAKLGSRLRCSVDGTEVFNVEDPQPLPGGKIGLWSWNNNLPLIARAKISFAGEE